MNREKARLDADRTAKPKTRLVARVEVPPDDGVTRTMVMPPANEYVGDDGQKTPLGSTARFVVREGKVREQGRYIGFYDALCSWGDRCGAFKYESLAYAMNDAKKYEGRVVRLIPWAAKEARLNSGDIRSVVREPLAKELLAQSEQIHDLRTRLAKVEAAARLAVSAWDNAEGLDVAIDQLADVLGAVKP